MGTSLGLLAFRRSFSGQLAANAAIGIFDGGVDKTLNSGIGWRRERIVSAAYSSSPFSIPSHVAQIHVYPTFLLRREIRSIA